MDDFLADMAELNSLTVDLGAAGYRATKMASAAVRKTAHDIEATAKSFVPVDTGATKNSIHVETPSMSTPGDLGLWAEIGPTTEYAPFLEYGTVRMAPYAFMGPALDRHAPNLARALRQIGGDVL